MPAEIGGTVTNLASKPTQQVGQLKGPACRDCAMAAVLHASR